MPPESLADVRTPALVLDRTRLEANIATMARRAADAGLALWPHVKTHKSLAVTRLQLAAGAAGLTVATLREADVLAGGGRGPLLLAQPPVGDWRVERVLGVARRTALRVALDSVEVARALDAAAAQADVDVELLWEVDPGLGRCGTPPGEPTAAAIAALLGDGDGLCRTRWTGLMTFPGHAYGADGPEQVAAISAQEHDAVAATVQALRARGIDAPVRSIGSTPTAVFPDPRPLATELRAGNYVYNDMTQVRLGTATVDDCALTVLGTVTSRPAPGRAILDCGSKALAAERMNAASATFGAVAGHPGLRVQRLFEEHAILESDAPLDVPVGARLRVIPNHACTAANLHDMMLVVDGGDGVVADRWPLDARGWD